MMCSYELPPHIMNGLVGTPAVLGRSGSIPAIPTTIICGPVVIHFLPGGALALLWHFGSVLKNPPVAVRATIRNRRRSEQLGDDGAADLRQRWLRRRSAGRHLFFPAPPPSGAGVADRQRRCRSSARGDAGRSRTGLRSHRAQVPA